MPTDYVHGCVLQVLERAQKELLSYQNTGISVMGESIHTIQYLVHGLIHSLIFLKHATYYTYILINYFKFIRKDHI